MPCGRDGGDSSTGAVSVRLDCRQRNYPLAARHYRHLHPDRYHRQPVVVSRDSSASAQISPLTLLRSGRVLREQCGKICGPVCVCVCGGGGVFHNVRTLQLFAWYVTLQGWKWTREGSNLRNAGVTRTRKLLKSLCSFSFSPSNLRLFSTYFWSSLTFGV